jgi:O-methyltransferase involved in polyketide biosynthesis
MRERFARITEKMGVEQNLDIQDLIYNDPDRADVAVWLRDHGWRSAALNSQDEMRRLGRFVDVANPDKDAFSTFVTAERL